MNVFDGKVYGFPFSSERRFNNAVLFNQDKMNEVGYDHINKDRALTFDEMRDAAKKIAATGMPGMFKPPRSMEPKWLPPNWSSRT